MSSRPVTVIGLDAMDPALVNRWIAEGKLPCLARIATHAARGSIANPAWVHSGCVWSTFFRGAAPDHTGLWDGASRFDPERYERRTVREDEVAVPEVWQALGRQRRSITLVDPPYELLRPGVGGVQIVDWLTHVRSEEHWLATQPAALAREIRKRWGENPWSDLPHNCPTNLVPVNTTEEVASFRDTLLQRVRSKTALAHALLDRGRPDLLCVVYHDAHDAGHMAWHVHDAGHERHDPEVAARTGDPLLDVYQALDAAVEALLPRIEDGNVLVVFGHGMTRQRTATRFLDRILGILASGRAGADAAGAGPDTASSGGSRASLARRLVPGPVRAMLRRTGAMRRYYERKSREALFGRRYFELTPNHAVGGVRLNLRGRERYGIVQPGAEADDVLDELAERLGEITNVESGEPLAKRIVRTDRVYTGPEARQLPDLMVEWNRNHPIRRVHSPALGTLEDTTFRPRSGDHLPDGMFMAFGPDVDTGFRRGVDMTEFAGTLAALLRVDHPRGPIAGLLR